MRQKIDLVLYMEDWFITPISFAYNTPWREGKAKSEGEYTPAMHASPVLYDNSRDKFLPEVLEGIVPADWALATGTSPDIWLTVEDITIPYSCHPSSDKPTCSNMMYLLGAAGLGNYIASQPVVPSLQQLKDYIHTRDADEVTVLSGIRRISPAWGPRIHPYCERCNSARDSAPTYSLLKDIVWVTDNSVDKGHWELSQAMQQSMIPPQPRRERLQFMVFHEGNLLPVGFMRAVFKGISESAPQGHWGNTEPLHINYVEVDSLKNCMYPETAIDTVIKLDTWQQTLYTTEACYSKLCDADGDLRVDIYAAPDLDSLLNDNIHYVTESAVKQHVQRYKNFRITFELHDCHINKSVLETGNYLLGEPEIVDPRDTAAYHRSADLLWEGSEDYWCRGRSMATTPSGKWIKHPGTIINKTNLFD